MRYKIFCRFSVNFSCALVILVWTSLGLVSVQAVPVEGQQVLINVNHIIDFLHSIKKNQDEMFHKLTKMVESTDLEGDRSRATFSRKVTALESKMADLERSIPDLVKQHCLNLKPNSQPYQAPRPIGSTSSTTTSTDSDYYEQSVENSSESDSSIPVPIPNNKEMFQVPKFPYQIDQPFTPSPLFAPRTTPSGIGLPGRNSRDISYYEPLRDRSYRDRPNYLRGPDRAVADRQSYIGIQLLEESKQKMEWMNNTLEEFKRKISNVERSMESWGLNSSRLGLGLGQNEGLEERLSSNSQELQALRRKQGELQRAVDTVVIHFSTIFTNVENAERRIDETQKNFTQEIQKLFQNGLKNNFEFGQSSPTTTPTLTTVFTTRTPTEMNNIDTDTEFDTSNSHNELEVDPWDLSEENDYGGQFTEYQEGLLRTKSLTPSISALRAGQEQKGPLGVMRKRSEIEQMQSDQGYSYIAQTISNLMKEVKTQKKQIKELSSEMARVNISHVLLLRTMDEETLKRTIRPKDCSEIRLFRNGTVANRYTIFPQSNDEPLQVTCDLDTDGGGWTLIQRRGHPLKAGEVRENFYRNWTDYEQGFGSVDGDFWIGLENIAALSKLGDQELRIELTKWNGQTTVANYKHFGVSDARNRYKLRVSGYWGSAGDSLSRHSGMVFSTLDQDNDTDPQRNCAQMWKGAWWYYGCHESNLNGLYASDGSNGSHEFGTGIVWYHWTGNYYSLKQVQIKIRNSFVVRTSLNS